jgi:hypothetical protein
MNPKEEHPYDDDLPGNYDPSEDVYRQNLIRHQVDPEDTTKKKTRNPGADDWSTKDFETDKTGEDLDVPGAELDDEGEDIGREDEENNYYSLGGDNHNDLEENPGE